VIACVSTPPFKKSSRFLEPVVNLTSDFLLSNTWSAVENSLTSAPESARAFLAFSINSDMVSVSAEIAEPSPPAASSWGTDTARSRTDCIPACLSLLIRCGCTPGKSCSCKSLTSKVPYYFSTDHSPPSCSVFLTIIRMMITRVLVWARN
jgi:hypothetical protein